MITAQKLRISMPFYTFMLKHYRFLTAYLIDDVIIGWMLLWQFHIRRNMFSSFPLDKNHFNNVGTVYSKIFISYTFPSTLYDVRH